MAVIVWLVLAVVLVASAVVSGQDYCTICKDHTMCKYTGIGAACKPRLGSGVTQADKDVILKTHNTLRQRVAQGKEVLGAPGPQPMAANMRELVWDEEIATIAQRLADQCVFGHDTCRNVQRYSVGQNIALTWYSEALDWSGRVQAWYNEVSAFNKSTVSPFKFSMTTGHYSQVVWANTAAVGCGYSKYTEAPGGILTQLYVCNYGPAGNYGNQPMYVVGASATQCPTGTKPSTTYAGLCCD